MAASKHFSIDLKECTPVLLVMGVQNDIIKYFDKRKDDIIEKIQGGVAYVSKCSWMVVYALELHHSKHSSFHSQGGLLPSHCVLGTWGSCYAMRVHLDSLSPPEQTVRGLDISSDSDDAFYVSCVNNSCDLSSSTEQQPELSNLKSILIDRRVKSGKDVVLFLCGVSVFSVNTIMETAKTALTLGFKPVIIGDLTFVLQWESSSLMLSSETHDDTTLVGEETNLIDTIQWKDLQNLLCTTCT